MRWAGFLEGVITALPPRRGTPCTAGTPFPLCAWTHRAPRPVAVRAPSRRGRDSLASQNSQQFFLFRIKGLIFFFHLARLGQSVRFLSWGSEGCPMGGAPADGGENRRAGGLSSRPGVVPPVGTPRGPGFPRAAPFPGLTGGRPTQRGLWFEFLVIFVSFPKCTMFYAVSRRALRPRWGRPGLSPRLRGAVAPRRVGALPGRRSRPRYFQLGNTYQSWSSRRDSAGIDGALFPPVGVLSPILRGFGATPRASLLAGELGPPGPQAPHHRPRGRLASSGPTPYPRGT